MLSDSDINNLIKEMKEGIVKSREEDQFGYPKISASDVYLQVIKRLKEMSSHFGLPKIEDKLTNKEIKYMASLTKREKNLKRGKL